MHEVYSQNNEIGWCYFVWISHLFFEKPVVYIPEFQLGNDYQVDYLVIGKNSDAYHFLFIELEELHNNFRLSI